MAQGMVRQLKRLGNVLFPLALLLAACNMGAPPEATNPQRPQLLASALQVSPSVQIYGPLIQRLYVAYFGRPADATGLQYWSDILANNKLPSTPRQFIDTYRGNATIRLVVDSFGNSDESAQLYGGDAIKFITSIYNNLFGRAPDTAGLNFWVAQLNVGNVSRGTAALELLSAAQGSDQTIVDNKVLVAQVFTAALDARGQQIYSGASANQPARSLLNQVSAVSDIAAMTQNALTLAASFNSGTPPPPGSTTGPSCASIHYSGGASYGLVFNGSQSFSGLSLAAGASGSISYAPGRIQFINPSLTSSSMTGSLRTRLWAVSQSMNAASGSINGYVITDYPVRFSNGSTQLRNGQYADLPLNQLAAQSPPAGSYCIVATLESYEPSQCTSSDGYCVDDWNQFPNAETFN